MKLLLDASTLLNIIRLCKQDAYKLLKAPLILSLTLKLVYELQAKYCYASYIALAKRKNLMPVIEDAKLRKIANKIIKAIRTPQLKNQDPMRLP